MWVWISDTQVINSDAIQSVEFSLCGGGCNCGQPHATITYCHNYGMPSVYGKYVSGLRTVCGGDAKDVAEQLRSRELPTETA